MLRRPALLLPLLLILVACSAGDKAQEAGSAPAFAIEYEKYTLDNGLDVILLEGGRSGRPGCSAVRAGWCGDES